MSVLQTQTRTKCLKTRTYGFLLYKYKSTVAAIYR